MTTPPDWHAADAAYQHHHANCPTCRAAGAAGAGGRLCVAGSWGQQRTVGINLPPQQHYFCVSPDKISSER